MYTEVVEPWLARTTKLTAPQVEVVRKVGSFYEECAVEGKDDPQESSRSPAPASGGPDGE